MILNSFKKKKKKQPYIKYGNLNNIFVIGDVHGCYRTLMKLIEKLPKDARLIFVGDLCDKGNFSKEVIEYVIANNHLCILGNHEQLMLDNINNPQGRWETETYFGGYKTLQSYKNDDKTLQRHLEWLRTLPRYIMKEKYFITHGFGLPYYKRRDDEKFHRPLMSNRRSSFKEWGWDWEEERYDYGVINIFGHDSEDNLKKDQVSFNLDTGCVYGKHLTAIELGTETLYTQETDLRDVVSEKNGFKFIPSPETVYGFTLAHPDGFIKENTRYTAMHSDTKYLSIEFWKHCDDGSQVRKGFLFDKERNHISWQQRHEEIKDVVETKSFDDGYKVMRKRKINFEKEFETTMDTLYKDDDIISTSDSLATDGEHGKIDAIYKEYLSDMEWVDKQEEERKSVVDELLSLDKKEQKHLIARIVIHDVDMSIFYGPVRDAGPIKEFPFDKFATKFKELERSLLEELFIHAQTVFALYMNEGECYENVNVKAFVKGEAEKSGVGDVYEKYFDEHTSLNGLRGLC